MYFCHDCGTKQELIAKFCKNCGIKLIPFDSGSSQPENESIDKIKKNQLDTSGLNQPGSPIIKNHDYKSQTFPKYQPRLKRKPIPKKERKPIEIDNKQASKYYLMSLIFPIGLYLYIQHKSSKPNLAGEILNVSMLSVFITFMMAILFL